LPASGTVPANAISVNLSAVVSSVESAQTATLAATTGGVSRTWALALAPPVPTLAVSTNNVAFGNVEVNTAMTKSLTLTSTGTGPVTVNAASLSGTGFNAPAAALPITLNPGQVDTLDVQFVPNATGAAKGNLTITSNSSTKSNASVSLTGTGIRPQNMDVEQPKSADSFVDSIGLNVHFSYYGSIYTNLSSQLIHNIGQLGVRHLRDQMAWQGLVPLLSPFYSIHDKLAASGVKTDYIVTSINYPMLQVGLYPTLVNDMEAVEAANEWDASGDADWAQDLRSQQDALCAEMGASSATQAMTVLSPALAQPYNATPLGNVASVASAGNSHAYFAGYNPGNSGTGGANNPAYFMKWAAVNTPAEPVWITETGFWSQPGTYYGGHGVTEAAQATYIPRALLEFSNAGAARTYVYELADWESGDYFGLIRIDGTLKPAFGALANLLNLLSDPGPAFTPQALTYSITGAGSNLHKAVFQKRDGSFYLALWVETSSYNFQAQQAISVPAQQVNLNLSNTVLSATRYQLTNAGTMTTTSLSPSQSLPLTITDKVQIVKLVLQ
jgi:hypothetical protein